MFYVIQNVNGSFSIQDYFKTEKEAEEEVKRLEGFFPNDDFFVEYSEGEPKFINA